MQRFFALVLLLAAVMVSLPLAALAFDGEGSENWILPAQLAGMAIVGGIVATILPGLVGEASSARRRFLVGAAIGVAMALVGVVVFFLILNGFDGA